MRNVNKVAPRSPGITNLKTFGRVIRNEPFYGYLKVRLYPERGTITADELGEWCGRRYEKSKSRVAGKPSYRICTYVGASGKRFVDRVFFGDLTEEDRVELALRFNTQFVKDKVVRDGKRRVKLKKAERLELNAVIDAFYADVAAARRAAALGDNA